MPSPNNSPFLEFRTYLQERYGRALHRVPLDLGFPCPHVERDGSGGCTYCGENRSRAAHLETTMSLSDQVSAGATFMRKRYGDDVGLIAYFQAATSTNAPLETFRQRVSTALEADDFPLVIISTRPDCLRPDVLDWLGELGHQRDLWIELGVQSADDETLARVNRGHSFTEVAQAARDIAERGIHAAAHVILGLPGEASHHFRETARALADLPFEAVKIHNLHVVAGTDLADLFERGEVRTMDEHEYGEVLMDFLRHIPADWPVTRLCADTPRERLISPKWWMSKHEFQRYLRRQMTERGWHQGDLADDNTPEPHSDHPHPAPNETRRIRIQSSLSHIRQKDSALTHLLDAADFPLMQPDRGAAVISIGFGSGRLALDGFDVLPGRLADRVVIYGLGLEPGVLAAQRRHYPDYEGVLTALSIHGKCRRTWGRISIHWGDPRRNAMRIRGRADLLILEPERPELCPMLFSTDFLRRALRLLGPHGVLVSASEAAALRGALLRLGLHLGQASPDRTFQTGTVAARQQSAIRFPLDEFSRRIAGESLSGIPYRDPDLRATRREILQHRERVVTRMRSRGMPARLTPP